MGYRRSWWTGIYQIGNPPLCLQKGGGFFNLLLFVFVVQARVGTRLHIHGSNRFLEVCLACLAGLSAIALFFKQLSLLVSYVKNNAFPQPLSE